MVNMAKDLDTGDQIPVSHTLAKILQALTLGASVTFTYPPNTIVPPISSDADGNITVVSSPTVNVASPALGAVPASDSDTKASVPVASVQAVTPAPAPTAASIPPPTPLVCMDPAAVAVGAHGNDLEDNPDKPFYVVTSGRKIGIFAGWSSVSPQVLGAGRCTYCKIERGPGTRNRAMHEFNEAFAAGYCCVRP
ncbi:hypothetical protein C0992_012801 [Termitomyces sp. T32_za158]|nr:hypothetical protein C0992_012801 [Termitomyces sp. T32_za158]